MDFLHLTESVGNGMMGLLAAFSAAFILVRNARSRVRWWVNNGMFVVALGFAIYFFTR